MTDNFALLGESRRPWLDPDMLKARFLACSAQVHPDRFHQAPDAERLANHQRFAELNSAHQCLREPKSRLAHLLELELGAKPAVVQTIPPGFMELFMEVGPLWSSTDAFLREKVSISSPLLKVKSFEEGWQRMEMLESMRHRLQAKRDALDSELLDLNPAWAAAPPIGSAQRVAALPLSRLEAIYRELGYLARWTEQLQERLVQLSF